MVHLLPKRKEGEDSEEISIPSDPVTCLETFIQFLPLFPYTSSLWLGLVPSLGGIAIGTVKQTKSSLSKYWKQFVKNGEKSEKSEKSEKYSVIFTTLLDLFKENIHNSRLGLPFLKTYHYLISAGHLDTVSNLDEHAKNILITTWTCIKATSDPSKKIEGSNVFCAGLRFSGS